MKTVSLETAGKTELRVLCKAAGISYGKLDNAAMRKALADRAAKPQVVVGDTTPLAASAPMQASEPAATTMPAPALAKKAKRAPKSKSDVPSIRDWLAARLAGGELKVEDAMAYAASTSRSKVTVHRQARELGYSARKGVFVAEKN